MQLSKVQVFTDVLNECGVIKLEKQKDFVELTLLDADRLEKFIYFSHEENGKVEEKQLPVTGKGVAILDCVNEFGNLVATANGGETATVDMEAVFKAASEKRGQKVPFEWSAFEEVVKSGFAQEIRLSGEQKTAVFQVPRFQKLFPLLFMRQKFRDLNKDKRDG